MASNFAIKYTDENYVTRLGLRKALGTSLVDNIWKEILTYRRQNSNAIELFNVSRARFTLTKTEAIAAKIAYFENKISSFSDAFASLGGDESALRSFEKENALPNLQNACKLLDCDASEIDLKAMVNGFYKSGPDEKGNVVHRHFLALNSLSRFAMSEDGLGELRFSLLGHDDVSSFYRAADFQSVYTTQVVARDYEYAPYREIEGMMGGAFAFLSSSSFSAPIKALLALYYLNYVKPFPENNSLLACDFARVILSSAGIQGSSALPFESCLLDGPALKDVLQECQKDNDLTYFIFHCIGILSPFIDKGLDRIVALKRETFREEFVALPEEEKQEAAGEDVAEKAPPIETVAPPPGKKIDSAPLLSEEEEKAYLDSSKGKNAIAPPQSSLSEKEVKETARYLLETNPSLRKKQALFYASHCTLGRFYTIQDFKKSARCAYETARTSMDGLAEQGFYAKKQIKNKFVYTPLKQGDGK